MKSKNAFITTVTCFLTALAPHLVGQDAGERLDTLILNGQWSRNFTIAGFSGSDGFAPVVYDFAQTGKGKVRAAGRFRWIGKRPVDSLAQLNAGGWRPVREKWDREVPGSGFSAIAISDGDVTALSTHSGPFGQLPGEIWLESESGINVIGHYQGAVRSIVWFKDKLWVAGFFRLNEGGMNHLAVWDGQSWSAPPGGSPDRAVYRLTVDGDSVLLAGDFTTVGGVPAAHIAEWNGQQWKAYNMSAPIAAAHVYAVTRAEGELFAGGAITGGVVRWNGNAWEPLGGGLSVREDDGVVSDMVIHKGDLYTTGCFTHAGGRASNPAAVRAEAVARWTGTAWEGLDDGSKPIGAAWFDWGVCGYEPNQYTIWDVRFQRLFSDGDRVFLGGMMPGAGGVPSQSIVAYDGQKWDAVGRAKDGLFGSASALAVGGPQNSVYAMGGVSHAGNASGPSRVFRFEEGEWVAVGGARPPGLSCSHLAVNPAGQVFLGCNTPLSATSQGRPVVLRLEGENWTQLTPPDLEGIIQDIRFDANGRLWIAGGVRAGEAAGSGLLARWDGDHFTIVEKAFNSMVFRIAFRPDTSTGAAEELIVGGAFTQIDSGSFGRIARWSNGRWETLGSGLTTAVLALAWGGNGVYVSTEPSQAEGAGHTLFGRWDGSSWIELGTPENGLPAPREQTVHSIRDMVAQGNYVVAVGSLWPESGEGRNVFVYDGSRIAPLAGGLNAISVDSVVLSRNALWFGGAIAEAGSGEERVPSVGIARFQRGRE